MLPNQELSTKDNLVENATHIRELFKLILKNSEEFIWGRLSYKL